MKHQPVTSFEEFQSWLKKHPDLFLLVYKQGSEQSDCAVSNLENIKNGPSAPVYSVNVAEVRDVHPAYHITTAPVIIEFKNQKPVRQLKGCHRAEALESFFSPSAVQSADENGKRRRQVIVYTTPTCAYCRTLKDYLRNNQVPFREIDVTKDEKAATEMVRRSGQQGVPQSLIDGQMVVGFDRNKINNLLRINA
ncbi:MAG: glutaredoxin domain-containing protein [Marinilabiliaceae bacterium]